jgi:hypothetical protein
VDNEGFTPKFEKMGLKRLVTLASSPHPEDELRMQNKMNSEP